jgi:hypothetical protein
MKAALSVCPGLLAGVVLLISGTHLCAVAPPEYDRIRVAALIEQLDDDEFDKRVEADNALRACGKLILPALHNEVERHASLEVRKRLEMIILVLSADEHVPGLVRQLAEPQPDTRDYAAWQLRCYGKAVVPLLKKELKVASSDELRLRLERIIEDLGGAR